jgi:hypothetical protein
MARYEAGTWPVLYSADGCSIFAEGEHPELKEPMEKMAVDILWNFSGRVFSTYPVTIRPQLGGTTFHKPPTFWGAGPRVPYPYGTSCGESCSCAIDQRTSIRLPGASSVDRVSINGVDLDQSKYWFLDEVLTLTDQTFPTTQDMRQPLGAPNADTWGITFQKGIPVPQGGQLSAGFLACELAKALLHDKTSLLSLHLKTATRNSSTATPDRFLLLDKSRTGLVFVDDWLASVAVERPAASRVFSVDVRSPA